MNFPSITCRIFFARLLRAAALVGAATTLAASGCAAYAADASTTHIGKAMPCRAHE